MNPNQASSMTPRQIVDHMMNHDAFSQWMGIRIDSVTLGNSTISMKVRDDMVNGFGILHGGVSFSLADSAFAFASNTHGRHAVSISTSISHFAAGRVGDMLTAQATEVHRGNKTANYEVKVTRRDELIASFQGTVYLKSSVWTITE